MVDWMRLGFVHGVMNTDNLSILGLTIDYGPYGWLEGYDLHWTPNTTDAEGRRYCYGNQPHVAEWNLTRLAEALLPLVPDQALLRRRTGALRGNLPERLAERPGAASSASPTLDQPGDDALVGELFEVLAERETDFTIFFRNLRDVPTLESLRPAFYVDDPKHERLETWLDKVCRQVAQRIRAHRAHERAPIRNTSSATTSRSRRSTRWRTATPR